MNADAVRNEAILRGTLPTTTLQFKNSYDEAIRQLHRDNVIPLAESGGEIGVSELPKLLRSSKAEIRALAVHIIRISAQDAQTQGPTGAAWQETIAALDAGIIPALFEELEAASLALFRNHTDISCFERLEALAACLEPLLSREREASDPSSQVLDFPRATASWLKSSHIPTLETYQRGWSAFNYPIQVYDSICSLHEVSTGDQRDSARKLATRCLEVIRKTNDAIGGLSSLYESLYGYRGYLDFIEPMMNLPISTDPSVVRGSLRALGDANATQYFSFVVQTIFLYATRHTGYAKVFASEEVQGIRRSLDMLFSTELTGIGAAIL